ncbi:MAG: aminomethyl-transferring glycine dehydrogenase subunit GcvPB [Planctomycetes bacterium]|nr:aminomethyl-transferring glycine dehydrogenase subunit GcvPB [Planctomycetota bacterium]
MPEPSIFEKSQPGQRAVVFPASDVPTSGPVLPDNLLRRRKARLPEVAERSVVRHISILSKENFSVDCNFYPLGSCTMKYNPRVNEQLSGLPEFTGVHPYQFDEDCQGTLAVLWQLQEMLKEITGLSGVSLQPAAGAHGELTAMLMFAAWFRDRGEQRTTILVPDSAHGTNPASAAIAGFKIVQVRSNDRGLIDLDDLRNKLNKSVAGMMLTCPNTLGLFESDVGEVARLLHEVGAKLYIDGANLNAILGVTRPGDWGADAIHINTHKTLSTPHGGGGPGAGPIAVAAELEPFLPVPVVERNETGVFRLSTKRLKTIGRVRSFLGQTGVLLRAYCYLRSLGPKGLRKVADNAVLNARYLQSKCPKDFASPYGGDCMHEFVLSATPLKKAHSVRALDIAKRLIDYGIHPPTVYFPLIVDEAMMIEPTETERRRTLDRFAEVLGEIVAEAQADPDKLHDAPHTTSVSRVDEVRAARELDLRYTWSDED